MDNFFFSLKFYLLKNKDFINNFIIKIVYLNEVDSTYIYFKKF
jgi:hypothetical protein